MMRLTDITALAGIAFAIAVLALRLPLISRLPAGRRVQLAVLMFIVVLLPFGGLSAAELVRGMTGDLSITTLVLLGFALFGNFSFLPAPMGSGTKGEGTVSTVPLNANRTLLLIVMGALALYPFALGIGMMDPYRLGYGDPAFVAGLLGLALVAWWQHDTRLVLCVALAVLAWSMGWNESNNLWNYLLDPWVVVYALVKALCMGWRGGRQR